MHPADLKELVDDLRAAGSTVNRVYRFKDADGQTRYSFNFNDRLSVEWRVAVFKPNDGDLWVPSEPFIDHTNKDRRTYLEIP